jgi:signal transduction histidine kinase
VFKGDNARSRLLFLLGIVLVAIALTVAAMRQFQRERAFARRQADFVAAVSHELRTPLAQIRLFLETLRLGRYEGEAERDWLLDLVDRETIRLSHLVSNVLQFSRANMEEAELAPADVASEAADVVRGFQPLARSRRATVHAELGPEATARINRELFRQLLLNLLDNAVKYGPEGQRILVRVARDNGSVRLSVTDQGPGIPEHLRKRIWEPFVRGDDAAARAIGGSGIGLSVVRDAVRRHGGTLELRDAPGGGSAFLIDFPAVPTA